MRYGYIRVSTKDQNEARQIIAMQEAGLSDKQLYMDKQSGKDFNRPAYNRLVKKLKKGDALVIKSIDRLGRNYEEILEQWRMLSKVKKVSIEVLDMPLLNTHQDKDLTSVLIGDIVLQLLSFVAETERENIHQRQAEGIAAAKDRGVRFGRPPMERPADFEFWKKVWKEGRISARQAGQKLGISHRTFLAWAREDCKKR